MELMEKFTRYTRLDCNNMYIDIQICFWLQAQHRQNGLLAAAKMCRLDGEDDMQDFMIEIDILTEIKHPNIVELLEAFQKEQQVSFQIYQMIFVVIKWSFVAVVAVDRVLWWWSFGQYNDWTGETIDWIPNCLCMPEYV